jgi:WhiB family transcriptional regulator, redox-sensing transcriptional regulator
MRRSRASLPPEGGWSWLGRAACSGLPVEQFVGPDGELPTQRRERERAAVRVCETCPVAAQCLAHALAQPELFGVWGGTTEADRAAGRRTAAA